MFVATKHVFYHDKSMLVAANVLSRQTRVCCEKSFVGTKIFSRDKHKHTFVATNTILKNTTKMMLVAAPANDTRHTI